MQDTTRLNSAETGHIAPAIARIMPKTMLETMPPRSAPDWKPQPCGLSREELRRIVRKVLG